MFLIVFLQQLGLGPKRLKDWWLNESKNDNIRITRTVRCKKRQQGGVIVYLLDSLSLFMYGLLFCIATVGYGDPSG